MDDLRTILDNLKDKQLAFVMARVKAVSTADALRNCGIGKSAYYKWPEDERVRLEDIAFRLQRESATQALIILQDASMLAADVKVSGLKDRDSRVKQAAATEILDRTIGKASDKLELSGSGGGKIEIEYVNNPYPTSSLSPESSDNPPES